MSEFITKNKDMSTTLWTIVMLFKEGPISKVETSYQRVIVLTDNWFLKCGPGIPGSDKNQKMISNVDNKQI